MGELIIDVWSFEPLGLNRLGTENRDNMEVMSERYMWRGKGRFCDLDKGIMSRELCHDRKAAVRDGVCMRLTVGSGNHATNAEQKVGNQLSGLRASPHWSAYGYRLAIGASAVTTPSYVVGKRRLVR